MSDPERLVERLDDLAEVIDAALACRDLAAYKIASTAYAAALDQFEAKVAEGRRQEVRRGLAEIEAFLLEQGGD